MRIRANLRVQGCFAGGITLDDGREVYGEALLSEDGQIRILIAAPERLHYDPEFSQFVGELEVTGDEGLGSGLLIGQGCASTPAGKFCGTATPAQIAIHDGSPGLLVGEIQFDTEAGSESWSIDMGWPTSTYLVPATPQFAAGLYEETIADFTSRRSQDTVIRVDNAGLLFFQSANSGCTANGSLEPHLEGAFNVYDATLTIENCTDAYQSLNGVFEGLATRTIEDGWWDGWGDWLVIMLSTPSGAPAQAAITMWGSRI